LSGHGDRTLTSWPIDRPRGGSQCVLLVGVLLNAHVSPGSKLKRAAHFLVDGRAGRSCWSRLTGGSVTLFRQARCSHTYEGLRAAIVENVRDSSLPRLGLVHGVGALANLAHPVVGLRDVLHALPQDDVPTGPVAAGRGRSPAGSSLAAPMVRDDHHCETRTDSVARLPRVHGPVPQQRGHPKRMPWTTRGHWCVDVMISFDIGDVHDAQRRRNAGNGWCRTPWCGTSSPRARQLACATSVNARCRQPVKRRNGRSRTFDGARRHRDLEPQA
jgi:hypothetical protein